MIDLRREFILSYLRGEETMAALCDGFGISRKTGYKFLRRFIEHGNEGLADQSRAPHRQARAVSAPIMEDIVAFKAIHPRWGPRKLRQRLQELHPGTHWPAASTIGAVLKRHGLIVPRRRRHRTPPFTQPFVGSDCPNDTWCADFKGWFHTTDGTRCDPFTLSDAATRFLLRCQVVPHPDHRWVKPIMDAAFREYGLPRAIRTDNGPPFASVGMGGLSRLAIEWVKLGIVPERIAPGRPEQNGRHERMHRTLNEHTATPPQANAQKQQSAFDRFREEYNYERPHEALGQQTPASVYRPSERSYPRRLPSITYPDDFHVRKVGQRSSIRWRGHYLSISRPLIGEWIGLTQHDDDQWHIYFGPILLATWNQRRERLEKPKAHRKGKTR